MCDHDPSGAVDGAPLQGMTEAEEIRRSNLGREANIRSMAWLVYLNGAFFLITGLVALVMAIAAALGFQRDPTESSQERLQVSLILMAMAAVAGAIGYWFWCGAGDLRRLSRTGRGAGLAWGVLSLINPPVGTLLGIFMLVILLDRKGRYVLSPEYRDIVGQTPHIEYKWSIITKFFVWLLAGIVLFVLVAGVAIFVAEAVR